MKKTVKTVEITVEKSKCIAITKRQNVCDGRDGKFDEEGQENSIDDFDTAIEGMSSVPEIPTET